MLKMTSPEESLEAIKYVTSMIYAEAQQSPLPGQPNSTKVVAYDFCKVNWGQLQHRLKDALAQDGWRTEADALADVYLQVKPEAADSSGRTFRRLSENREVLPEKGTGLVVEWTGGKLHLLMAFPPPVPCVGLRYSPHLGELELVGRGPSEGDIGGSDPAKKGSNGGLPTGWKGPAKEMASTNPLFISNAAVLTKNPNANLKKVFCEIHPITTREAPPQVATSPPPLNLAVTGKKEEPTAVKEIAKSAEADNRPLPVSPSSEPGKGGRPPGGEPGPKSQSANSPRSSAKNVQKPAGQKVPTVISPAPYVCDPAEIPIADLSSLLDKLTSFGQQAKKKEDQLRQDREKLEAQLSRRADMDRKVKAVHKQELRYAAACAEADEWEQRRRAIEAKSERIKSSDSQ
jgi:hypothetical protein